MAKLTKAIARKVLEVVDAGLCEGMGDPVPGEMCVEAAVCFAMGEPHGDKPSCVSRAVRSLKITLNDKAWSSNQARAQGMRRLAIAQLGTKDAIDDKEFAKRCADLAIRKMVPIALRAAAKIQKNAKHRDALLKAANRCEVEGTKAAAATAAYAAATATAATATAAYAAAATADAATKDKILSDFAEDVVQILIDLKSPGTKWLDLTEAA